MAMSCYPACSGCGGLMMVSPSTYELVCTTCQHREPHGIQFYEAYCFENVPDRNTDEGESFLGLEAGSIVNDVDVARQCVDEQPDMGAYQNFSQADIDAAKSAICESSYGLDHAALEREDYDEFCDRRDASVPVECRECDSSIDGEGNDSPKDVLSSIPLTEQLAYYAKSFKPFARNDITNSAAENHWRHRLTVENILKILGAIAALSTIGSVFF